MFWIFKSSNIDRFISSLTEEEFCYRYSRLVGYFNNEDIKKLWGRGNYKKYKNYFLSRSNEICGPFKDSSNLIRAFLLETEGFLSHNLIVADKSSMAESIELRVPFVNPDIFITNFKELLNGNGDLIMNKYPLKKYLEQHIPKNFIYRKKQGFNPPLKHKITSLGERELTKIFDNGSTYKYLSSKAIKILIKEHFNDIKDNSLKLWQLLYFNFWLEEFIS